jgi:uncharacterized membrane protein
MEFETSKNLGGVGAILLFVSVIPYISSYTFGLLGLVGLILLLVGMKGLAEYYREAGIFNNALYGTITGIAGVAVVGIIVVTAAIDLLSSILPGWAGDWTSIPQVNPADISSIDINTVWSFLAVILLSLVVLFVFVLIVSLLYRKSLNLLHDKSGVGMFGTVGTLLLVGAVLTIIIVGLVLIWVAVLLTAIAFFQLKPQQAPPIPNAPPMHAPVG